MTKKLPTSSIPSNCVISTNGYDANGGYQLYPYPPITTDLSDLNINKSSWSPQISYVDNNHYIAYHNTKSMHIFCDFSIIGLSNLAGFKLKSTTLQEEPNILTVLFEKKGTWMNVIIQKHEDHLQILFRINDKRKDQVDLLKDLELFKNEFISKVEKPAEHCSSCIHKAIYTIEGVCSKKYEKILEFDDEG